VKVRPRFACTTGKVEAPNGARFDAAVPPLSATAGSLLTAELARLQTGLLIEAPHYTAVELSPGAVLLVTAGEASRLAFAASFDAVAARSDLMYAENKAAAAREFRRALRVGGRVSVYEPINRRTVPAHWFEALDASALPPVHAQRARPAPAGARSAPPVWCGLRPGRFRT
jgi:SAM-dependent methyltransferase